jgi:hypothetical protein
MEPTPMVYRLVLVDGVWLVDAGDYGGPPGT